MAFIKYVFYIYISILITLNTYEKYIITPLLLRVDNLIKKFDFYCVSVLLYSVIDSLILATQKKK